MENENQLQTTEQQIAVRPGSIPIDAQMVARLKEQRKVLMEYISSQLKEGSDFGIIPGCKKPSLWKPGAEKLRTLFNLKITMNQEYRELDRDKNFGLFCYKAAVIYNDALISECEGSCNSQEKKYAERKRWDYCEIKKKKLCTMENTPVCDILNTIQKMSQKRASVGAITLAVGASDFFNQDFDDYQDAQTLGVVPQDDNSKKNNEPNVTNVSNKPDIDHDKKVFMVEALTSYEERDLPKDAKFKWDGQSKKWLKEMTEDEYNSFNDFEVVRL